MDVPTVLIVEDSRNDRFLFERAMEKAKLANRFHFAVDGLDAIRYFTGEGKYSDRSIYAVPALVLMDYHMPLMNGPEVLQWLRAHEQFKKIPVVMMTATADDWEIKRACDSGADDYLRKPGDLAGMVRLIEGLPLRWAFLPEPSAATSAQ